MYSKALVMNAGHIRQTIRQTDLRRRSRFCMFGENQLLG